MKLRIRSFRCRRIALLITIVIIILITTRLLNLLFEEPVDKLLSIDAKQPPVINPQLKHPESDQELRQIQPPVPIPPDDDYDVKNVPKQPVISFPISENSSPFEAFKEGTLISKEETQGGLPVNKTIVLMRDKVREMMKFAWNGYATYAWGSNELRPVSKTGHLPSVLGTEPLGASLIDGLDTLYIMNMDKEFDAAVEWIEMNLDFNKPTIVSVFEFNIRYIGGLLSAYTFSRKPVLLAKAVELAQRLLPAFDTPSGIPMSLINLKTGDKRNFVWAHSRCSILSEFGTLHMEFKYLSELTGNPVYAEKVDAIRRILAGAKRPNGLFMNFMDPNTKSWCNNEAGLSALGDSFYEYLLKEWIRTNHKDEEALELYNSCMQSFLEVGLFHRSPRDNLLYVGNYRSGTISDSMDHLACFVGGMLTLGAPDRSNPWFQLGVEITETCRRSYNATSTGLGPEVFSFTDQSSAIAITKSHKSYLLRPETVESYFYLWRLTKDPKYRDWAWDVVQALEKYARTNAGYSGLQDVYSTDSPLDDVQQTYFLAETLKYLYLIFSDDTLLPLDRWVFNSEAHPLPIQNKVKL
ncbi:Mannosyl-oligosaccharide 1,2-alpha-mannosidase IB [Schistosoma japonicum]|uniref:alpha-1,2-Mannosidase n=1 Tax=Schistosoma japonicum TaxID=6182 RepID=A0A4Z2DRT8_SCHJA|nr:Mannosyl-oligosaccharide 1,2-alpha-mannosidase IB [Schistosoma japonicum]TNN19183.1 Mannosyl-oligosaccharide 1,2-alpha-mannosidase IB [Schistosoma japonicum]